MSEIKGSELIIKNPVITGFLIIPYVVTVFYDPKGNGGAVRIQKLQIK